MGLLVKPLPISKEVKQPAKGSDKRVQSSVYLRSLSKGLGRSQLRKKVRRKNWECRNRGPGKDSKFTGVPKGKQGNE